MSCTGLSFRRYLVLGLVCVGCIGTGAAWAAQNPSGQEWLYSVFEEYHGSDLSLKPLLTISLHVFLHNFLYSTLILAALPSLFIPFWGLPVMVSVQKPMRKYQLLPRVGLVILSSKTSKNSIAYQFRLELFS